MRAAIIVPQQILEFTTFVREMGRFMRHVSNGKTLGDTAAETDTTGLQSQFRGAVVSAALISFSRAVSIVFSPDRSFVIDDVKGWRRREVPLPVDLSHIVKRPPVYLLLSHYRFEFTGSVVPGIDADYSERLVFQCRHERPLVGPSGPSGQSEFAPEIEQHHFSAIVAQLELLPVLILPRDVGGDFAVSPIVPERNFTSAYSFAARSNKDSMRVASPA